MKKSLRLIIYISIISAAFIICGCDGIFPTSSKPNTLPDHTINLGGAMHKNVSKEEMNPDDGICKDCHTKDIRGRFVNINGVNRWTPSCFQCHGALWENRGGGKLLKKVN